LAKEWPETEFSEVCYEIIEALRFINPGIYCCIDGASGRYDRLKDTAFEYAWMLKQVGMKK
jgi:hypothetical protein